VKKLIFISLLAFSFTFSYSQEINVRRIKKLPVKEEAWFPDFGRNKNEILLSGKNYDGLVLYNSICRKTRTISNAQGAGKDFRIDDNGNIIFSETTIQNGKKIESHKIYRTDSKAVENLDDYSPERTVKTSGKSISIEVNDETVKISPVGDKFYIWTSLSPDRDKIVFTAAGDGTYVSDLQGNIITSLGYINAPVWINNHWVVGMNDVDDGEKIISSDIVAVHIDSGKRENLTKEAGYIAQYPKVSPGGNRIVFHSLDGNIYIMKISLKD
jgi:hypothetical protein